MPNEQLNLEWVIKAVNDTKAGVDSALTDYKRLGSGAAAASKQGDTIGGMQQQQRMSGLHTRISQLTGAFRKFGLELETIDLYFISGFKVVGLFKLLEFAKQSIFAFEDMRKGMIGIQLATEQGGQLMENSMVTFNNLLKMGKLGAVDLAEAMRNLLKRGMDTQDVEKVIKVLTMSGTVFGTQHGVPLGEAVKRSTEGLLLEISNLVDATRLTKNLKNVFEDYGKTIGKTGDELDRYEKNLAIVAWMIQENIGLAEKYTVANTGVTAALSEFAVEWDKIKRGVGEGLNVPITLVVKKTTATMQSINQSIQDLATSLSFGKMFLNVPADVLYTSYKKFVDTAFKGTGELGEKVAQEFKDAWSRTMLVQDQPEWMSESRADGQPEIYSYETFLEKLKRNLSNLYAGLKEMVTREGTSLKETIIAPFKEGGDELSRYQRDFANLVNETFGNDSVVARILGLKGAVDQLSTSLASAFNPAVMDALERSKLIFSSGDILSQHLSGYTSNQGMNQTYTTGSQMWWNKKEETGGMDFGKRIDAEKLEQAQKAGEKIAQAFSYPIERGISDVFFSLFSGEKSSFAEMARNFGLAIGRAISDALAETLVAPVKKIMTSMFTSMMGNMAGGGLAGLFTTSPSTSSPITSEGSLTVNAPVTVYANDVDSFARTLKQTSKLTASLFSKEMQRSRAMEKQFKPK